MDDIIFWSKLDRRIHDIGMKLHGQGVNLEREEMVAGFIGVHNIIMEENESVRLKKKQCDST